MKRRIEMMVTGAAALSVIVALVQRPAGAAAQGAGGGTIVGRVNLTAEPEPNRRISMGADPYCREKTGANRPVQDTVLRAADGGLANVFLHVKGSFPKAPASTVAPRIEQQGCVYRPRVQGAQVGQTMDIVSNDDTLHNIHFMTNAVNAFNTSQPKPGTVKYQLRAEEVMLHVRCDVHNWMTAYIGIVTHPYFAVSDASGTFTISNVPPGRHTLQAWHEKYGPLTRTIDVKAGATAKVDFTFTGKEAPAAAELGVRELRLPEGARFLELIAAE